MADLTAHAVVDPAALVLASIASACHSCGIKLTGGGEEVGESLDGGGLLVCIQSCEEVGHHGARLGRVGGAEIRADPLRAEPTADSRFVARESRSWTSREMKRLLSGGGVAIHAAEFPREQEPSFHSTRVVAKPRKARDCGSRESLCGEDRHHGDRHEEQPRSHESSC